MNDAPNIPPDVARNVAPDNAGTIAALEGHVATLKADVERLEAQLAAETDRLAAAETRADKQAADFAERDLQRAAELATERAKTEKAIAEFAAMVDRLTTLADEKAKTEKAIAAFAALADRLDALAAERARPWWRRIRRA
jgi:uncharacterized coiled-coil protein SlyX